ncbi:MAG: hypothetical protein GWP08_09285 [Nitrospiraceae bacterium]|nr:hypothetical protein [Nitrospiraceae bacterium]
MKSNLCSPRSLTVLAMLPIAAAVLGGCAHCPGHASRSGVTGREFQALHVQGPIEIDGVLDEDDWKRAAPLKMVTRWNKTRTKYRGVVYVLWDEEYAYFACDFEDSDLYAEVEEHDGKTWNDDAFEVFLQPEPGETDYFEIHVTARGTTMDLKVPAARDQEFEDQVKWESGMKGAVELDGTLNKLRDRDVGWTAEMRIPWAAFAETARPPKAGDAWRFAACRYDYTAHGESPIYHATARFKELSFHRTQEYDWLRFVE